MRPSRPDYSLSSRRFGVVRLCRGRLAVVLALALAAGPLAAVAGAASDQQQAAGLPGPVVGLDLSATADSLTVSWQAPEVGGAAKGYIVHIKPEGGRKGSGKTKRPKANRTAATFRNLNEGTTYAVWVRARNEAGKGERTHAAITLPDSQPAPELAPETELSPEERTTPDELDDSEAQQQDDSSVQQAWTPQCDSQEGQSTDSVLVGNFGQQRRLSDWSTNNYVLTQGFTTGNAAAALDGIEVSTCTLLHVAHIATIRAELWSAAPTGEPESKLVDLVVPEEMGEGDVTFTAPPNTVLRAGAAYHFVLYTTGRVDLRVVATYSLDEDAGSQDGWSISDLSYDIAAQTPQGGSWVETTVDGVMLMRVRGHEQPPGHLSQQ